MLNAGLNPMHNHVWVLSIHGEINGGMNVIMSNRMDRNQPKAN